MVTVGSVPTECGLRELAKLCGCQTLRSSCKNQPGSGWSPWTCHGLAAPSVPPSYSVFHEGNGLDTQRGDRGGSEQGPGRPTMVY